MWIKICGVRDPDVSGQIADQRPDAIGLNFYAPSPRSIPVETAAGIVKRLPAGVEPVGLFVNATAAEIRSTTAACGLQTIQLHGAEPLELVAELAEFRVIRAFRVGADGLDEVKRSLDWLDRQGISLWGALVDASVSGFWGGTGQQAPWELLAAEWPREACPRWILAGGLTPENVAAAIAVCRPWGVDVAGGVESAPGAKDPELTGRFIENARRAS